MKRIIYFIICLLTFITFGCEKDHRNDNLYDSAVYFVNSAANGIYKTEKIFYLQETFDIPIYVYCSGYYGGEGLVQINIDESIIEKYNDIKKTKYKVLSNECYEIIKSSEMIHNRKATLMIRLNIDKIKQISTRSDYSDLSNYVIPIVLSTDGKIKLADKNEFLKYCFITPLIKKI